jgi:hypothetical protein
VVAVVVDGHVCLAIAGGVAATYSGRLLSGSDARNTPPGGGQRENKLRNSLRRPLRTIISPAIANAPATTSNALGGSATVNL